MSTKKDIDNAVNIFKKNKCEFELMHCVSTYPTNVEDVNLKTINALKENTDVKLDIVVMRMALLYQLELLLMGITSLERHITLDRTMYGSDQAASIEEKGMMNLSNSIDKIILALGEEKLGHILKDEDSIAKKVKSTY